MRLVSISYVCLLCSLAEGISEARERFIQFSELTDNPVSFATSVGEFGEFTWWLPEGSDAYVLPISAGMVVDASRSDLMKWLRDGSPWSLMELPVLGLRYGNEMLVFIVPWPHYAELVVRDRIGIRFSFPEGRHKATPCELVAMRRKGGDPMEVARAFRAWRDSAMNTGAIPRPRPLAEKLADLEKASHLPGAPHVYLWGPALFSQHDAPRRKWASFAKALRDSPTESLGGKLTKSFTVQQRGALDELTNAESRANTCG